MNNANGSASPGQPQRSIEAIPGAHNLGELLENPEVLEPPTPIAARFVWPGRITLLAGREKLGKSTLGRNIAAAVSSGRSFLDEDTQGGPVLYLALEEHLHDVARKLRDHESDRGRTTIVARLDGNPVKRLKTAVEAYDPALVVIDTLAAFASSLELDPGSSSDWTPVLKSLRQIAEDSDSGFLILHHARKSDGQYRDSTAIGAGVDVILTMKDGGDTERDIEVRGRLSNQDFTLRFERSGRSEGRPSYQITGGQPPLENRVLSYVRENPECSSRDVRKAVAGRATRISEVLGNLESGGRVANVGNDGRHRWVVPSDPLDDPEAMAHPDPRNGENTGGSSQVPELPEDLVDLRIPADRFPDSYPGCRDLEPSQDGVSLATGDGSG